MKQAVLLLALLTVAALGALFWLLAGDSSGVDGHQEQIQPGAVQPRGEPSAPGTRAPLEQLEGSTAGATDEGTRQASQAVASTPTSAATEDGSEQAPGSLVLGRCVDERGSPLEGVELYVGIRPNALLEKLEPQARTGTDGRFRITKDLDNERTGTEAVTFHRQGLGQRKIPVTWQAEREIDLGDILLSQGVRITGRIVTQDGRGLEGVSLRIEEASGQSIVSRLHGPSIASPQSKSRAKGEFELVDVPAGEMRLWAGGERKDEFWPWTSTKLLALEPGDEIDLGSIELKPLEAEDSIRLTVINPEGDPVPGALVSYSYDGNRVSGTGTLFADEHGALRHLIDPRVPYSYLARDPRDRFRPAIAEEIEPGTHDLVLQLAETIELKLHVQDADGKPIESYEVQIQGSVVSNLMSIGNRTLQAPIVELYLPAGDIVLTLPILPFTLKISAPGYALESLGPLDPERMELELEVQLHSLPGIHGRITADGRPVAGAKVSLHGVIEGDDRLDVNNFPCLTRAEVAAQATTDGEGRYTLNARKSGLFVVRVEAPGYAPAVGPNLRFDPKAGAQDVDLELGLGGTLVGRVAVFGGEQRSGLIVGISRGDGFGFTLLSDANGEYRADGLTPGDWQVLAFEAMVTKNRITTSSFRGKGEREIPWGGRVFEGRETRIDLDLRNRSKFVLKGHVALVNAPLNDSQVYLSRVDGDSTSPLSSTLDSEGNFELRAHEPGTYALVIQGRIPGTYISLNRLMELQLGDTEVSLELPTGNVHLTAASTLFDENSEVYIQSQAHPDWTITSHLALDHAGEFLLQDFPSGPATITHTGKDGVVGSRDIRVPEGDLLEVHLQ